jgi:hypothetical protein
MKCTKPSYRCLHLRKNTLEKNTIYSYTRTLIAQKNFPNLRLTGKTFFLANTLYGCSVRDQMETWRKVSLRHAGNSSLQLQQRRGHRLEFYLDDSCDRLKTCRDGYFLMEQKIQEFNKIAKTFCIFLALQICFVR